MRATIRYPTGAGVTLARLPRLRLDGACAPLDLTRKASLLPAEVGAGGRFGGW